MKIQEASGMILRFLSFWSCFSAFWLRSSIRVLLILNNCDSYLFYLSFSFFFSFFSIETIYKRFVSLSKVEIRNIFWKSVILFFILCLCNVWGYNSLLNICLHIHDTNAWRFECLIKNWRGCFFHKWN